MQPEVEFDEPDIIIPWALVAVAALLIGFVILEALLIGRGATPLDELLRLPSPARSAGPFHVPAADAGYLRERLLAYINRDLMGPATASMIAVVVLAGAFAARGAAARVLMTGFGSGSIHRKELLHQGEILIGISGALWAVQILSRYAVRPGFGIDSQPVPIELAVAPIAFWGSLAQASWTCAWTACWRYVLTCAFAVGVVLEIWYLLAHGVYATTLAPSLVLGSALLLCARWLFETYGTPL